MPLAAGQTLSFYEILGPLGAGGMGEVWRARDTRLDREVAIKVLPEDLADDEERLRRFEREAKTLASLHHPNIASIFGIDQVGETCFIAMEHVPGEDLAARLARGRLPVDEAVGVCRQIAEGLEAAHEAGVVHRDLKPANVRVTPEGVVKILDFGLAKPMGPKAREGSTAAEPDSFLVTEQGMVLGTPTYMSPEQARGRPVDRRTDVWAFGCVMYECLTGARAFGGESLTDVLAAIVEREPDWDALPPALPAHVRALLRRCLVKDPHERLRDVGEARIALGTTTTEPAVAPPARRRWPIIAAALAFVAGFLLSVLLSRGEASPASAPAGASRPSRTLELPSPGIDENGYGSAISPDGRTVATIADGRIRLHSLEHARVREIAGTDGAQLLAWSPDGRELAYRAGDALWRVELQGGGPSRICHLDGAWVAGAGLAWGPGGRIALSTGNTGLYEVSTASGEISARIVFEGERDEHFHVPSFLPDGDSLVYARHGRSGVDSLEVLVGGERKTILRVPGARLDEPCWSPTGHIVYRRELEGDDIWALPFSLERMEATDEPFLVVRGSSRPTVSADGTLAHFVSRTRRRDKLGWVDGRGVAEPFGEAWERMNDPALAPDGKRVAVTVESREGSAVYVHDLERGTWTRITSTGATKLQPSWAPGDRIVYSERPSGRENAFRTAADGTGEPELLVENTDHAKLSADGRWLVFGRGGGGPASPFKTRDLYALDLEQGGAPVPVVATQARERKGTLSPDARLIAYRSDASGRHEIYLQPFPSGDGRWQVSRAGGDFPRWSPEGDRLFYVESGDGPMEPRRLMSVSVRSEPTLALGVPEPLFECKGFYTTDYDPAHDRFLAVVHTQEGEQVDHPLRLTFDWH